MENARDSAQPVAHRNPDAEVPGPVGKPERIASPLQIMIEGPIGGAAFNNEFGRPNLGGYFRVYEQNVGGTVCGYTQAHHDRWRHRQHRRRPHPQARPAGRTLLVQLGGPACASAWAAAPPARWRPAPTPPTWTSIPCSAATPRCSAARRKSSTPAGRWVRTTRSCRSTTWARAASPTPSPNSWTAPTRVHASTCARCTWKSRA